ncbi:MAG: SWIM zinc finger family protein, partial [Actinomycetota bacterium]|nr:SWIM zinc finger family protein [Actinomycetota bacterium]
MTGGGPQPYTTVAEYDDGEARWWGECSCPVGLDCKHVAAVLLVTRASLDEPPASGRSPGPDWERALADLVQAAAPPDRRGTALGLQFEVEATGPRLSVRLRPVVPGAKGRWIRTGVSWRKLEYDYYSQRDPAQSSALRALYRAHQTADGYPGYYGYGSGDVPVRLEEFGPALWPALQQVVDADVALVTATGAAVRLAGEVFSQFTGFLRTVRNRLDAHGLPYTYLDGRTRNRQQRIDEFRGGRAPIFLISLKAGGF